MGGFRYDPPTPSPSSLSKDIMTDTMQSVLLRIEVKPDVASMATPNVWHELRLIPAYLSILSAVVLSILFFISRFKGLWMAEAERVNAEQNAQRQKGTGFVKALGGHTVLAYKSLRLLACATFLGTSVALFLVSHKNYDWPFIVYLATIITAAYTFFLSVLLLSPSTANCFPVATALNLTLLATLLVYGIRDVWPYATFDRLPLDHNHGPLIWIIVGSTFVGGIFVPLFIPRIYQPINTADPSPEPAPEQTASLISLLFYSFLDPLVFLGTRVSHLSLDQIPPLPDYDGAAVLKLRAFKYVDPSTSRTKRKLVWGILQFFWKPLLIQALMICGWATMQVVSPIALNRLLVYLETDGADALVRPWFWILCLFLGPLFQDQFFEWYLYSNMHCGVVLESVITQLIFEHALRIRMKAETHAQDTAPPVENVVETPATEELVIAGASGQEEDIDPVADAVSNVDTGETTAGETEPKAGQSQSGNLIGRINNLISTDLAQLQLSKEFLVAVVYCPIEITLDVIVLYMLLGWSSIVGLAVMIILLPIPAQFGKELHELMTAKMKATDDRVQSVTEVIGILRMIKLFAWENHVEKQVAEKRDKETVLIWKRRINDMLLNIINRIIPVMHMVVTYWVYTIFMKKELTPSIVFSSITLLDVIRDQFLDLMWHVPNMIQGKVSLDRMDEFLTSTELLDKYTSEQLQTSALTNTTSHTSEIGFGSAHFAWTAASRDGSLTPSGSRKDYLLRIDEDLIFKKGTINLIVGPTGSGKTSILMALLGEMHFIPASPSAWFNLPRGGGVAYAAQESWVQNETIKANILFNASYDESRYQKVIYQCALTRDLEIFDAGDLTEVGEKGITLSGGQKARLTLARAVYSSADILLLDDVLAALDVHTSRWIVEKCFKGDLIQGRTVILVTHNVVLASPISDFVIVLDTDGRIRSRGSVQDTLNRDSALRKDLMSQEAELLSEVDEKEVLVPDELTADTIKAMDTKTTGKLIVEEEVEIGRTGTNAFALLAVAMAGRWGILYWFGVLGCILASEVSISGQVWWLGQWANAYEDENRSSVNLTFYLGIYILFIAAGVVFYAAAVVQHNFGSFRASVTLHQQLLRSVMTSTLRWLDSTPTSRVITRFTQDMNSLDSQIVTDLYWSFSNTGAVVVKLIAVVILTPVFLIPGVIIGIAGGYLGNMFISVHLSLKRQLSVVKSPVVGHFGAAITGLVSIRAYGFEDAFKIESRRRIDEYSKVARSFWDLNRWLCVRVNALSFLFSAALAAYMVYVAAPQSTSNVGFSINMAAGFSAKVLIWLGSVIRLQLAGTSLERIRQYLIIEHEPEATEEGQPPAAWPTSGKLVVERLSARYSPDGPQVLKDISFTVNSGERIGIVGRTGSGKSSLTLSLLRMILMEGEVYFDGLPISKLNLDELRANITIIPQMPELLSGTLRHNLDPYGQHEDATLNDVLRSSGLISVQSETEGRLSLDSPIASGGGNLSVGQKQILALGRAMLRQSKILILDEATSAIDYETDTVIQQSLRNEFKDVTIITVAHRLQTIMDSDKIMVLEEGKIVEFDRPSTLLTKKDGHLYSLVNESCDKDVLISMTKSGWSTAA